MLWGRPHLAHGHDRSVLVENALSETERCLRGSEPGRRSDSGVPVDPGELVPADLDVHVQHSHLGRALDDADIVPAPLLRLLSRCLLRRCYASGAAPPEDAAEVADSDDLLVDRGAERPVRHGQRGRPLHAGLRWDSRFTTQQGTLRGCCARYYGG